jgi:hypothetical protein
MKIVITDHANNRLKERCGLQKKAKKRTVEIAFEKGILHSECVGRLKNYVDHLYQSHGNGNNIRIYGNHVYIFYDVNLVTVLTLPNEHRAALNKVKNKRKELANDIARIKSA